MKKSVALLAVVAMAFLVAPQTAEADGRPLSADLSSTNEVPDSGTGASGSATFTLNQGQGTICFSVQADGLAGAVLAGHIHVGEAGANGGVVVNLGLGEGMSRCVDGVDKATIKAIRQSPESYYINVHTSAVPSGEIRGQLSK